MADGKVVIETSVDTSQAVKDINKLSDDIKKQENNIPDVKIKADKATKEVSEDVKQLMSQVEEIISNAKTDVDIKVSDEDLSTVSNRINKILENTELLTAEKIKKINAEFKKIGMTGIEQPTAVKATDKATKEVSEDVKQTVEAKKQLNNQTIQAVNNTKNLQQATTGTLQANKRLTNNTIRLNSDLRATGTTGNKSMQQIAKGTDSASKSVSNLQSSLKRIAGLLLAGFSIRSLINFGKQSVETASDLVEVQNVVDTAFGSMSSKMEAFAQTSVDTYGISKLSAKNIASTYAAMGQGIGQGLNDSTDKALEMTGRVADIASFYNLTLDKVNTIGRAVYSGETEPLKQIGVIMTEAQLGTFALSNGYKTLYKNMSAAEKLEVRQAYFLSQTNLAAGDFVRTQDSWANQTRVLTERWKEFMSLMGTGLIQMLQPVVKMLNSLISAVTSALSKLYSFLGVQMQDTSAKGIADISDGTEDLSDNINNVAKNTKKATKAAKQSIAPFDELVMLNNELSSGDKKSNNAGKSSVVNPQPSKITTNVDSAVTNLDLLKAKFLEIKELFDTGFKIGLGDNTQNAFNGIKDSISNIKAQLNTIFTDPKLVGSVKSYADSVVVTLGALAGSMTSVGISLATNLLGGFSKYLTSSSGYITKMFTSLFKNLTSANKKLTKTYKAIAEIFEAFASEPARQLTGNIISIVANTALGITTLLSGIYDSFITLVSTPIIDNATLIKTTLIDTFASLNPALNAFNVYIQTVFNSITDVFNTKLSPAINTVAKEISGTVTTIVTTYSQYIVPFINELSTKLSTFMSSTLTPFSKNVIKTIGDFTSLLSKFWKNVLSPILNMLVKTEIPKLVNTINAIWNIVSTVIKNIVTAINNVISILDGVIIFLEGVFTLDIKKVFEGIKTIFKGFISLIISTFKGLGSIIKSVLSGIGSIISYPFKQAWSIIKGIFSSETVKNFFAGVMNSIKNVFSPIAEWFKITFSTAWENVKKVFSAGGRVFTGIKDGILNGLKAIINALIKGINTVISVPFNGLNKALKSIHDVEILGVKPFDFIGTIDTPQIPMLATGAVLPANKPFLSVVGDQKHGTNIEAPLDTIKQALMEVMASNTVSNNQPITVEIDGQEVFRVVRKEYDAFKTKNGYPAFS